MHGLSPGRNYYCYETTKKKEEEKNRKIIKKENAKLTGKIVRREGYGG